MNTIKYLIQFIFIGILFIIFKIVGYKIASNTGGIISSLLGPFFRSKTVIKNNIKKALPDLNEKQTNEIIKKMWTNYGRILADYMFIKKFRKSELNKNLTIEGKEILQEIKDNNKPVIFISGHFNNFELMAMEIEKSGIDVAAIYRPLNNFFLNKIMESIRKKYICKQQIKKGISGIREIIRLYKNGYSVALMIDQRVSEGIYSKFFKEPALTTTIPAQLVRKYDCKIVPIYIQRVKKFNYKMTIDKPLQVNKGDSVQHITDELNCWLEKKIMTNPDQWIWSHNRWK